MVDARRVERVDHLGLGTRLYEGESVARLREEVLQEAGGLVFSFGCDEPELQWSREQ